MKPLHLAFFTYLSVCAVALFIPASENYNTYGWKLFVAQIYAIPIFFVVLLVTRFINKKKVKL